MYTGFTPKDRCITRKTLFEKTTYSRKMPTYLEISGHFCVENFSKLDPNHSCLLTATSTANNYNGCSEFGCFHKTSAYLKILAVSCVKIWGGAKNNGSHKLTKSWA